MASRETRARSVAAGDYSLCPRPQVPRAAGAFEAALETVWHGTHPLRPVVREGPAGQPELMAEGDESPVVLRQKGHGKMERWTARRWRGRSVRQAQAAEASLRARVATALAQLAALNQRGRGPKRFEEVSPVRPAAVAIVPRYGVEDLLWFRLTQHGTPRPVRASRGQRARIAAERQATMEVGVDEVAVEAAVRRVGWRVYGTHHPGASLSLAPAVWAYRSESQGERSWGRLKGRPLSLTPMSVQRDDHATGRMRLWSIALRVLTRVECVGRRQ